MKLVPYTDYVLCEEIEEPKQTEGGILLPETMNDKTSDKLERGKVTDVAELIWANGSPTRVMGADIIGKTVLYQTHAGYWYTDKAGKKLRIIQYKDICAVEVED